MKSFSKHDTFEQLMCYAIYYRIPYILIRDNSTIKTELGLKQLLTLGILN